MMSTDAKDAVYDWRTWPQDWDSGHRLYFTHQECWRDFHETRKQDVHRSREAGIDSHLVKPVQPAVLQKLLERLEVPA